MAHRREFLKASAAVLAAPMFNRGRFSIAPDHQQQYSVRCIDLLKRALVIDMLAPLHLSGPIRAKWLANPASLSAESAAQSLEDLLREGEIEGVGAASERAIISGVVEFGTKQVRNVMTARADIVAVERGAPPDEVARVVSQSKFSRIPVFDRTLDHPSDLQRELAETEATHLELAEVCARPAATLAAALDANLELVLLGKRID